MGLTGAGTDAASMLTSGYVFFICTEDGAGGGSGKTVIRAVAFFGPGGGETAGLDGLALTEIGGGTNLGGWTGFSGAGGIGGLATGGRDAPGMPAGGRDGNVIRTVSRLSTGLPEGGVNAMRTVSFFGSVGSAIKR